jgi:hypothetical protein
MKFFVLLSFLFLPQCSYIGLSRDLNAVTHDSKIEALRREEQELHPLPIFQGLTTESMTEIKVISKKSDNLIFKVYQNDNELKTIQFKKIESNPTQYQIHSLVITNLRINTNYTLQILIGPKIIDQRNFETVDLSQTNPKIGVVSCMHDRYKDVQFKMWNDYLKQNPTYTFMIGDNVYADTLLKSDGKRFIFQYATEDMLWKRYIQTFKTLSYYRSSRLIPTLAIWDDHDYGINNGDESYPYKKESLKVFEAFYGFDESFLKAKITKSTVSMLGGAGYSFKAFGQNFIFMDNRSFRSDPSKLGKDQESHLGLDQTAQIMKSISNANLTWLIKGDQFFGGYHKFESFETNHPNDFKKFLSQLKDKKAKVFFVSGDRHLNELMRIPAEELGSESYELTSSAIHASIYPDAWKNFPNPRQVHGASGIHNYSVVELKSQKPWTMSVISYGPKMKVLFEEELVIGENPSPNLK